MRTVRLFISSPGDVADERSRARQVVERLRRRYIGRMRLEHVFWEDLPLLAHQSFQEQIDVVLSESGIDVAVFILWSRLGSPLGPDIRRPDGTTYLSGTEREYDLVRAARTKDRQQGRAKPTPDCLVYLRRDQVSFDERLRGKSTKEQAEIVDQKQRLETFVEQQFTTADGEINKGAYHSYNNPSEFSRRLRTHLQLLLDDLAGGAAVAALWDIATQGAPFRGLDAFEPEHAQVFFGREDAIAEVKAAMTRQAQGGCAFVLISGASGSGKSSLARAGVLPAIQEDEVDAVVSGWRSVIATPAGLAATRFADANHPVQGRTDLVAALFAEICDQQVLPEVLKPDVSFEDLLDVFRRSPEDAYRLQIKPALASASGAGNGLLRLIIVVDQLEELFSSKLVDARQRATFLDALETLARTGSVWILATIRSDFYQHVESEPALVRMKFGSGQFDLQAPAADDLRRIIEDPAISAGLRFEANPVSRKTLADRILADVARLDLLPLLQYVLREVYEQRQNNMLTFEAYRKLGGVEGALSKRAEQALEALSSDAQRSLSVVLQAVVTMGQHPGKTAADGDAGPGQQQHVRQWADLGMFPEGTPARALVDKLVEERLFTTDSGKVSVAHESLLRVWTRAAAWAKDNHDFLLIRARVGSRMQDGIRVLEPGPLLSAARLYLKRNPTGFLPAERAFIKKSVLTARAKRGAARALGLALVGGLLGLFALRGFEARAGELTADAQRELFRKNYIGAERAAARSLTYSDSRERREVLLRARAGGIRFVASSRSRENSTLPTRFSSDGLLRMRTDASSRSITIDGAGRGNRLWTVPLDGSSIPDVIELGPTSAGIRMLAVAGGMSGVAIWQLSMSGLRTSQSVIPQHGVAGAAVRVTSMAFHPRAPRVLLAEDDCTLSLWDYSTPTATLVGRREGAHDTDIHAVAFADDGNVFASAGADFVMRLWNTADLERSLLAQISPISEVEHKDSIFAVALSRDKRWLASAGYERIVRVWDTSTGTTSAEPKMLRGHENTVLALAFSEDGTLLASGGADETARIWNIAGSSLVATIPAECGTVNSIGWRGLGSSMYFGGDHGWSAWLATRHDPATRLWNDGATVQSIAYDPGGAYMAVAGDDGTIRIVSRNYETVPLETKQSKESINGIVISPDGVLLAAGDTNGVVHVWRRTGRWNDWEKIQPPDANVLKHAGGVWGLCFGPDGKWLASGNTADVDQDRRIRVWHTSDWKMHGESDPLAGSVYALACDPSGARIVSGDGNGRVTSYDAATLKPIPGATVVNDKEGGSRASVWSVAITSKPNAVLSGNSDGRVHRWIPNDSRWTGRSGEEHTFTSDQAATVNHTINSISYSSLRRQIAAGGDGNSVELYDGELRRLYGLPGQDGTVWWVTFSPDGSHLAFGGLDGFSYIWNLDSVVQTLGAATVDELVAESIAASGGPSVSLDWTARARELIGMLGSKSKAAAP